MCRASQKSSRSRLGDGSRPTAVFWRRFAIQACCTSGGRRCGRKSKRLNAPVTASKRRMSNEERTFAREQPLHEPSGVPPGFGVRQSSGALAMEASQPKAPEDWRSPRRYRAIRRFMVPMHAKKRKEALHEPNGRSAGHLPSGPNYGLSFGSSLANWSSSFISLFSRCSSSFNFRSVLA